MSVEITVSIKDDEKRRLTRPFLIYETVTLSESDQVILNCVEECIKEFKGEPTDIIVKAKLILR